MARIAIGSDHAGYDLKAHLVTFLTAQGHEVDDQGTHTTDSVDYPDICAGVGRTVVAGDADWGIVLGGSGQGEQLAANKVRGVRAALCNCLYTARMAREHNDANVLSMGGPWSVSVSPKRSSPPLPPPRSKAVVTNAVSIRSPLSNPTSEHPPSQHQQGTPMPFPTTTDPDTEVEALIAAEVERQTTGLQLIASENFTSPAVMAATGSVLTNKYSEGYPGKRYYGGNVIVDSIEQLAIDRVKELFGADHATCSRIRVPTRTCACTRRCSSRATRSSV